MTSERRLEVCGPSPVGRGWGWAGLGAPPRLGLAWPGLVCNWVCSMYPCAHVHRCSYANLMQPGGEKDSKLGILHLSLPVPCFPIGPTRIILAHVLLGRAASCLGKAEPSLATTILLPWKLPLPTSSSQYLQWALSNTLGEQGWGSQKVAGKLLLAALDQAVQGSACYCQAGAEMAPYRFRLISCGHSLPDSRGPLGGPLPPPLASLAPLLLPPGDPACLYRQTTGHRARKCSWMLRCQPLPMFFDFQIPTGS